MCAVAMPLAVRSRRFGDDSQQKAAQQEDGLEGKTEKLDDEQCAYEGGLIHLLHQMASLSRRAEDIFSQVRHDIEQLSVRSSRLKTRLDQLETDAETLPNPRTMPIGKASRGPSTR